MTINKITLGTLLNNYSAIIIPDIQRDYVLGSGGENLKKLLDAMRNAALTKSEFTFSCIMGHVNQVDNTLAIYDGQQRITTLIYLCAYFCQDEINKKQASYLLKKFKFVQRDRANEYLHRLLSEQGPSLSIVDFTTFSIHNLLEEFKKKQVLYNPYDYSSYKEAMSLDFLLNHVYMEIVLIDEIGDVEQFFIDLNDGLDLKEYEIFKAELYHKAKTILGSGFKKFTLAMENEWLQLFKKLTQKDVVEEEIEILFIQFCLYMMWTEDQNQEHYNASDIEWIEARHLQKLEGIMNHILSLDLSERNQTSFVNYAFGKNRDLNKKIEIAEGAFWNLRYIHYPSLLRTFLHSFYEKVPWESNRYQIKEEAMYDILLWAYISNLDKQDDALHEYLRSIKFLLNKNTIENRTAYYDNKHQIWFTAYSAYGIPSYYTKLNNSFAVIKNDNLKNEYLLALIQLNKHFNDFINSDNKVKTNNERLAALIHAEQNKRLSDKYEDIKQFENLPFINGFVENLLNANGDPIINYVDLLNKLDYKGDNYQSLNEVVGKLLNQISFLNVENLENHIFKHCLDITWHSYTKNKSTYKNNAQLAIQTLTDFFVEKDLKPILQAWIKDEYNSDRQPLTDNILYLRAYPYLKFKGFCDREYQIVRVNNYYDNENRFLGLYSSKPLYGLPYTIYKLKDKIKTLSSTLDLSNCDICIKNSIIQQINGEWLQGWVTKHEIHYCENYGLYFALLDDYIGSESNGEVLIEDLVHNNKVTILYIRNKYYYVPHCVMFDYLKPEFKNKHT